MNLNLFSVSENMNHYERSNEFLVEYELCMKQLGSDNVTMNDAEFERHELLMKNVWAYYQDRLETWYDRAIPASNPSDIELKSCLRDINTIRKALTAMRELIVWKKNTQ